MPQPQQPINHKEDLKKPCLAGKRSTNGKNTLAEKLTSVAQQALNPDEEDYDSDKGGVSAVQPGTISIDSRVGESAFGPYDSEQMPLNKSFSEQDCQSVSNKQIDNCSNLIDIDQFED